MTDLWTLFLGLAGTVAVILFVFAMKRWPLIAAISAAINVIVAWELPLPPALTSVGGTSVYFLDILAIASLTIAIASLPSLVQNLRAAFWPWIGLGILLVISLAAGLAHNPLGTTMNEFRSFLYPYALTTWAMSLEWNKDLTKVLILRFSLILGWALTVVAGYHFALHGLGSTSGFVDGGTGLEQTTRPLVSGQSLVILLCGMVSIWSWRKFRKSLFLISAVTFFLVVAVSQQRTVWAVGIASLVVVFLAGRAGTKAMVAVFGLVTAWLLSAVVVAQIVPQLIAQLASALEDSGTYDARVRSWTNLIEQSILKGSLSVIFGQPMGEGFGRFEGAGRWVVFAPHNWYLTLYLRVGIVGLALFVLFLALVLIPMLRPRSNMAALGIASALVVYGWSYSWLWYVAIFLGWAIAQSRSDERQPTDEIPANNSELMPTGNGLLTNNGKRFEL